MIASTHAQELISHKYNHSNITPLFQQQTGYSYTHLLLNQKNINHPEHATSPVLIMQV
jgi:hypothetical protein